MEKSHLYIRNQVKTIEKFPKRGFPPQEKEEIEEKPFKYEHKKRAFYSCLSSFNDDVNIRHANRIHDVSGHIDYVKIYFHGVLNNDLASKYSSIYGLIPVRYEAFNHTVLFGIADEIKFEVFKKHIEKFIEREEGDIRLNEESFLLVHIDQFELLKSNDIIGWYTPKNAIIELIDNSELVNTINSITSDLVDFLEIKKREYPAFRYSFEDHHTFIELQNTPETLIELLADNFDIVYKIQSHTYVVKPSSFGVRRLTEDFEVIANREAPFVGVIDTGVHQNSIIGSVIKNFHYDLTNEENPLPVLDMNGHGTSVAGLVALGMDFFDTTRSHFQGQANIVPIKVLEDNEGTYSLALLESVVRDAVAKGVRIFNISMTSNASKFYNESVSEFAYLLDKLAYELDILFFIAAGNLGYEDMKEIRRVDNSFHNYPNHFFNPGKKSFEHDCECSNINSPAESYNNMTVGAIAENLNSNESDLTYSKDLPAYYTKKFHFDFSKKINGYHISKSLINKRIHKPDVVYAGGDALDVKSGMEVLSVKEGFFSEYSYGTSNAAPLVANIAANIKNYYPRITSQSIKALIINSATVGYNSNFLKPVIDNLKLEYSQENFGVRSLSDLTRKEKTILSKLYNQDRLFSYLLGHGVPVQSKAIFSSNNEVTILVEQAIKVDSHKGLIINLPQYLGNLSQKSKKSVVSISATLCYSFPPVFNNHLGYCPLHISFALFKPLDDDLGKSIDILADYTAHEKTSSPEKKQLWEFAKKNREFKNGVKWSDDYSPKNTKPFSNTQKVTFSISGPNIISKGNKLNLLVRCTCKSNIDPEFYEKLKASDHKFSIALRIEEQEIDGKISNNLYNRLLADNQLEAISDVSLDSDIDLNV